jgi:hypothetical protein
MAGIEGDVWKQEHDHSHGPKREPGPIELNRYVVNSHAHTGIASFMNWPICITPDDLKAGEVIVAAILVASYIPKVEITQVMGAVTEEVVADMSSKCL